MANVKWTAEEDARLRQLWADGVSVKKIAETLCVEFPGRPISRNGVIGRAHRLGLPARESIIKRRDPNAPRETPGPKPKSVAVAETAAQPTPKITASCQPTPCRPVETAEPSGGYTLEQAQDRRGCRWTDSKDRPFLFCGARTQPGRSFCAEHRARAYTAGRAFARPYAVGPK